MYRTRLGRVVFAFLASVAFIPDAAAKTVFVGNAKLELPTPPDACFLDLTHPYDARFIGVMQELNRGANLVLAAFTNCQELVNVRRQSQLALENYGMVLAPIGQPGETITADRAAFLDAVAGAIGEEDLFQEVMPGVRKRLESFLPEISIGESRSLGVIGRDSEAVYLGLMMRVSAASGYDTVMAGVVAMSVAGRIAFSVNLYRPHFDDSVFDDLKAEAQAYVRAVLAANAAAPVSAVEEAPALGPETLEEFMLRTANPRNFTSDSMHPDARVLIIAGGKTVALGKTEIVALVNQMNEMTSAFEVVDFRIDQQIDFGDFIAVLYTIKVEATVNGVPVAEESRGIDMVEKYGESYRFVFGVQVAE